MGSTSLSGDATTNFYLTGYADVNIAPNLSIQPGLSLQGKGSKAFSFDSDEGLEDGHLSLMYLEVPVNFVYYISTGTGNLFVGAGPYAAYGISVKQSVGNRKDMQARQDRYAEQMKSFGLDRGIRNTGIKHESAKEYYATMEEALTVGYSDEIKAFKNLLGSYTKESY